jgi:hypothetical protein
LGVVDESIFQYHLKHIFKLGLLEFVDYLKSPQDGSVSNFEFYDQLFNPPAASDTASRDVQASVSQTRKDRIIGLSRRTFRNDLHFIDRSRPRLETYILTSIRNLLAPNEAKYDFLAELNVLDGPTWAKPISQILSVVEQVCHRPFKDISFDGYDDILPLLIQLQQWLEYSNDVVIVDLVMESHKGLLGSYSHELESEIRTFMVSNLREARGNGEFAKVMDSMKQRIEDEKLLRIV